MELNIDRTLMMVQTLNDARTDTIRVREEFCTLSRASLSGDKNQRRNNGEFLRLPQVSAISEEKTFLQREKMCEVQAKSN